MTYNSNLKFINIVHAQNILEGQITLLEPRPLLDGRRLITPDPSNPPVTSPTKSCRKTGICGPRHISTAGITLHLTSKQADVLWELIRDWLFTEQVHQKIPVQTTVIPQHPTSVWKPRHVELLRSRSSCSVATFARCSTIILAKLGRHARRWAKDWRHACAVYPCLDCFASRLFVVRLFSSDSRR